MRRTLSLARRQALALGLLSTAAVAFHVFAPARARASEAPFGLTPLDEPKPLPELRFQDADGKELSLADFRGKVVLLNVWATWCVPCREEMPTLDRLQAKLGGPDFEVVALSIDRGGLEDVSAFFAEIGIQNLRVYLDQPGASMRTLGILGVPTTLLIDRQGREVGRLTGPAEWDSPEAVDLIRRYLDEPVVRDANRRELPSSLNNRVQAMSANHKVTP